VEDKGKTMKSPKIANWHILILILIFALILRLPGISANFTGDEIDTVGPARNFVVAGDFRAFDTAHGPSYNFTHPPVRTLLYSYWALMFGFSDIALRLVSIVFDIFFIVVVFLIAKSVYSEKVSIIAAGLAAVSRYSIWFADTASVDTGHFLFTTSAAVLFFLIYVKNDDKRYLGTSFIFLLVSMLTKFSTIIIFIPIIVGAYFYKKSTVGAVLIVSALLCTIFFMFVISSIFNNGQMFEEPLKVFLEYSSSSSPSIGEYLFNKVFKVATISWQMTPFFAIMVFAAIYTLKKTKDFFIMACWLILGFFIVFVPYGQDSQRYFGVALTPAYILVAKYIESFDFRNKVMLLSVLATVAISLFIGLNDLMGYYAPAYLGIFYIAAVLPIMHRKYMKPVLMGGFLGLSLFFALTHASNLYIVSDSVDALSKNVIDNNYMYKEVWASKDIAYYITPKNETVYLNLIPDINFFTMENLRENNVMYIAFYSTPDENKIIEAAEFCLDAYTYSSYGHTIGFVCRVDQGKL